MMEVTLKALHDAAEKLAGKIKEQRMPLPKWLMYPRWMIDEMGADEAILFIENTFGVKMTLKHSDDTMCVFVKVK